MSKVAAQKSVTKSQIVSKTRNQLLEEHLDQTGISTNTPYTLMIHNYKQ